MQRKQLEKKKELFKDNYILEGNKSIKKKVINSNGLIINKGEKIDLIDYDEIILNGPIIVNPGGSLIIDANNKKTLITKKEKTATIIILGKNNNNIINQELKYIHNINKIYNNINFNNNINNDGIIKINNVHLKFIGHKLLGLHALYIFGLNNGKFTNIILQDYFYCGIQIRGCSNLKIKNIIDNNTKKYSINNNNNIKIFKKIEN